MRHLIKFGIRKIVCLASALLWFQFERNKLERLMQARDEEFKEKLTESILKRDESVLLTTIFFPEMYFFLKKNICKNIQLIFNFFSKKCCWGMISTISNWKIQLKFYVIFGNLNIIIQIDAILAVPIQHIAKQYCQKDGTKNGVILKLISAIENHDQRYLFLMYQLNR